MPHVTRGAEISSQLKAKIGEHLSFGGEYGLLFGREATFALAGAIWEWLQGGVLWGRVTTCHSYES